MINSFCKGCIRRHGVATFLFSVVAAFVAAFVPSVLMSGGCVYGWALLQAALTWTITPVSCFMMTVQPRAWLTEWSEK